MRRPELAAALTFVVVVSLALDPLLLESSDTVRLEGDIVDAASGARLPGRVYVHGPDGDRHVVRSASAEGSAVPYVKRRGGSVEVHTTLSAHRFTADLPPGEYTVTAVRGKEYFPAEVTVRLETGTRRVKLGLRRFIDMAARGWYSGDTHVHRGLDELPNLLLAEDLNVAFPLVHWVTHAFRPPSGDGEDAAEEAGPEAIRVDATHLIWPRNTEYEIFSVGSKRHTLGAFFVIGHRTVFDSGVPPVEPIARKAREEHALIELDKHGWPWSMCLVPVMDVDLYELTNNHVWRTDFLFRDWGERPAAYMDVEQDEGGMTERGWIDYGFQNYYALLNCGFRLRPTAGTASGVHPVPLGFGRVYVQLEGPLEIGRWLRGLDAGRSFVTTGPMLFLDVDGRPPGSVLRAAGPVSSRVRLTTASRGPLERIELVSERGVVAEVRPQNRKSGTGALESSVDCTLTFPGSGWIAARIFEKRPDGRVRFAHSSPVFVEIEKRPLRPRRREVEFLIERVEKEIARSRDVLPEAALAEYRKALEAYRSLAGEGEAPAEPAPR